MQYRNIFYAISEFYLCNIGIYLSLRHTNQGVVARRKSCPTANGTTFNVGWDIGWTCKGTGTARHLCIFQLMEFEGRIIQRREFDYYGVIGFKIASEFVGGIIAAATNVGEAKLKGQTVEEGIVESTAH